VSKDASLWWRVIVTNGVLKFFMFAQHSRAMHTQLLSHSIETRMNQVFALTLIRFWICTLGVCLLAFLEQGQTTSSGARGFLESIQTWLNSDWIPNLQEQGLAPASTRTS
jgi:hypothetical protein